MPKLMREQPKKAWVKNVYSQRIQPSKTGVQPSPICRTPTTTTNPSVHKAVMFPRLPQSFTPALSTKKTNLQHLSDDAFTHFPQDLIVEAQKINLKRY